MIFNQKTLWKSQFNWLSTYVLWTTLEMHWIPIELKLLILFYFGFHWKSWTRSQWNKNQKKENNFFLNNFSIIVSSSYVLFLCWTLRSLSSLLDVWPLSSKSSNNWNNNKTDHTFNTWQPIVLSLVMLFHKSYIFSLYLYLLLS